MFIKNCPKLMEMLCRKNISEMENKAKYTAHNAVSVCEIVSKNEKK